MPRGLCFADAAWKTLKVMKLWLQKFLRAPTVLARYYTIQNLWIVLPNEILCICVVQGDAKHQKAKLRVRKKDEKCARTHVQAQLNEHVIFLFKSSNLTFGNFSAPWAIPMQSISFESPYKFWMVQYSVKIVAAFLRSEIFIQNCFIYVVLTQ